jgi:hypothetical protein
VDLSTKGIPFRDAAYFDIIDPTTRIIQMEEKDPDRLVLSIEVKYFLLGKTNECERNASSKYHTSHIYKLGKLAMHRAHN